MTLFSQIRIPIAVRVREWNLESLNPTIPGLIENLEKWI